jgi:hypothetical protein
VGIQDEIDERKGTEAVEHRTSTSDPVQYHTYFQTAWQAAAPLWRAWFEVLEAEEEGARRKPDSGREENTTVAVKDVPKRRHHRGG